MRISSEARAGAEIVTILPGQRFEQKYFQTTIFIPEMTGICFVTSRVSFRKPDGTIARGNTFGSMMYVFNGDWDRLVQAFSPLGLCVQPRAIVQQNGGGWE